MWRKFHNPGKRLSWLNASVNTELTDPAMPASVHQDSAILGVRIYSSVEEISRLAERLSRRSSRN